MEEDTSLLAIYISIREINQNNSLVNSIKEVHLYQSRMSISKNVHYC